jgi:hypothetical protein
MNGQHPIRLAALIGAAVECVLITPLLLFGDAAAKSAPWLVTLQAPGALPILQLFGYQEVRRIAGRLSRLGVVVAAQLSAMLIQTIIFGFAAWCLIYVYQGIRRRHALRKGPVHG